VCNQQQISERRLALAFILRTAETWKRHGTLANVYIGQLSYLFSDKNIRLPDDPLEAWNEAVTQGIGGFSVETGTIRIIASDRPVIFASKG
jgi:hypothetical protein